MSRPAEVLPGSRLPAPGRRRRARTPGVWLGLLVALGPALAAEPPAKPAGKPTLERLKLSAPSGPITVTANRAELERDGAMLYRGEVRLVSDQLVLTGDRLELRQPAPGQFEVLVTGRPARLSHAARGGAPAIAASAGRISYATASAVVNLSGGAQLERGTDVLTSEAIRYDMAARNIQATGENGSQVKFVIQQPAGDASGRGRDGGARAPGDDG